MTKRMRTLACLCFSSAIVCALAYPSSAAPPWNSFIPFRRVEADSANPYYLTKENGPWMVLAANFSGVGAEKQAHQLVLELRSKFKLPAYVHKRHYDFTGTIEGRGVDKYNNPKKMRYDKSDEFDAVAVMVGNYESTEDSRAQETLETIKYARPDCLDVTRNKNSKQRFVGLRELYKQVVNDEKAKMGPMRMAFLTRNPLLPKEQFETGVLDKFVISMNRAVEHSLLDCPGKYSVKIATFRGLVTQNQRKIEDYQNGQKLPSKLAEAAEYAHKLTETLRKANIEAYEFHDRYESIVTVGSFDWAAKPGVDERQEINPAIHRVMEQFKARNVRLPGRAQAELQPQIVAGIPCDIQPTPITVPGKSASAAFHTARR